MKNIIASLSMIILMLAGLMLVPLAFKWGMELLFAPAGWQVWLLLGAAVFAIEQFSAPRPRKRLKLRTVPRS